MKTAVCITNKGASVYIDGKTFLFNHAHPNYQRAIDATKAKQWDLVPLLVDLTTQIKQLSPKLTILGGKIYFNNEALPTNYLVNKLIQTLDQGGNATLLALFIENLQLNPSEDSREELGLFLDACKLPITDDGHFLAYKLVADNYMDQHTKTMNNAVGQVVEMDRAAVDDNRNQTCSHGLHVCSRSYLGTGQVQGKHLMVVKVNPRDVVSVPTDYNNSKLRCCRYLVVEEIIEQQIDALEAEPVITIGQTSTNEPNTLGMWGRLRRFFYV
jgi:hypothetical protein